MMVKHILPIAALIALGTAVPALATQTKKTEADAEIVCKHQSKTGTRFAKKTCRTRAQWEELYQKSRREAEENLTKPTISIEKGN